MRALNLMSWMLDVKVEKLTKDDALDIENLFERVWPNAYEYPEEWRRKRTLKREQIKAEMDAGYYYFGIRLNGKLVGVYKALITELGLFGEHQSVDPDYRGRGLATAMYHQFLNFAKDCGCKSVYVNILVGQTASERIVERLGFRRKGHPYEQAKGMLVQMYELEV